jgi:hypothetical protein
MPLAPPRAALDHEAFVPNEKVGPALPGGKNSAASKSETAPQAVLPPAKPRRVPNTNLEPEATMAPAREQLYRVTDRGWQHLSSC